MLVSLGRAASIGVNIENIEEKGRAQACLEQWSSGEMQPSLHNEQHSPAEALSSHQ